MISKLVFKNTVLLFVLLILSCGSSIKKIENKERKEVVSSEKKFQEIKTGADNFTYYLPLLKGKKVGIVTNQTGILSNKTHLVDFLLEKNINLQKIFAPEHGFRGSADAGEHVIDGKDSKTGLPIVSLYGDNKKPKPEQLKGIDVMLFDLQDVGVRFYTYISSLHYIMEACAENNVELIVLDRPNPNGSIVDGPILEKENSSFVGMHVIPLLHGMTIGEYAQMIDGEKWLKNGIQCSLKVIPCLNYKREMSYSLPVKPSPNLPNDQSINLYASLCLFEGTTISVGRGTEMQFQIYGSPYLPKSSFSFTPKPNFGAKDPVYNGKLCYGENLTTIPKVSNLELKWLMKAYNETPDKTKFFNPFFTKLAGTKKLQQQIEAGIPEFEIRKSWEKGLNDFKTMRKKYLIYD
ncbi:MAG: DUF1343 domain-containing protein [Flavobacterium sp.]|jgi:uncharacterized protein YbbC (DUF1343 family)|uniref:exo-beta-N-acetylmuramidase NamZ family protein n=1 Tax=Flavobacterium sp. TaxID=239 RepID=UPI0035274437